MRNTFVLAVFALLVTCIEVLPASTAATPPSMADQASLPSSAEQTLAQRADAFMIGVQQAENFNGVVLIARNSKVVFARPYGMANVELDVPNTLDTKFRLASITKQFTAAAILILQERGKLSVNDTLCTYLSDCPATWKTITIHQLLTHSSGIYSFTESSDTARYDPLPMPVLDTVALFKDKPLDFAPGTSFHYSDSGYLLLGYIIERASGQKYEDFMKENIYEPLHMQNSGYDHPWIILKGRAQGYAVKDGSTVNAAYMYMDTPFGGGSQYSTVGDLLLWDQALYGEKFLSRSSLTAMFSPNSAKAPSEWLVGEKGGYGYGWMIRRTFWAQAVCPRRPHKRIFHHYHEIPRGSDARCCAQKPTGRFSW